MKLLALIIIGSAPAVCPADADGRTFLEKVRDDHIEFYSWRNAGYLGAGLTAGGAMANTDIDSDIRDWYKEDVRCTKSDDLADAVKPFGDGGLVVPVYVLAGALSCFGDDSRICGVVGEWGLRSLRGTIVGLPPMLTLQVAIGSGRPVDDDPSDWKPFSDNNGVSGHAFMGAVPFLTAARMTDNAALKGLFGVGAALTGLSRINDDSHYASQVLLGWWLAWLATESVDSSSSKTEPKTVTLEPLLASDFAGMEMRFVF